MKDKYFDTKEFKANLKKWEDAVASGNSVYLESEDLTDIAEYYHTIGRLDFARDVIDYAIQLFPGSTSPLVFRSRIALLIDGNIDEARKYAEMIDEKTDFDYYYIIAEIMIYDLHYSEANDYLIRQLDNIEDEDDREDYYFDVANLFADYECWDYAEQWLNRSSLTDSSDYKELKGRIALGTGKFTEGEDIYNKLIDENPFTGRYWNQLAASQFMRNDIAESIQSSEYSIAINPTDEEAILNKANGLFQLGNYEEALKYYRRYISLLPNDETGYMFIGITMANQNRLQEAIQYMQKAIDIAGKDSPNIPEILKQMAYIYSQLGKIDKAFECIDKTKNLLCNHNEMLVLRGHIYMEHGKTEEAVKCYEKAVADSHESPYIFFHIAVSVFDCGAIKLAYKMLTTLFKTVDKDWKLGYSYMAICAMSLGKKDECLKYVKIAVEKNPIEARAIIGDILPKGLEPEDYYNYLSSNQMEDNNNNKQ